MGQKILRKVPLAWILLALILASPAEVSSTTSPPSSETTTPVNSTASTETTTPSNPTTTPVVSTVNTTKSPQTEAPPGPTQSAQTTTTSNKTTAQPASTVTSRMTSGTTQTPVLNIRLTFHITNREFNSSLEDPNSAYYQEMNETIGQMYWNIYACPTCERKDEYQGYKLLGFRNGSIEVLSEVYFQTKEEPQQLAQATQQTLENANATELNNLSINSVKASPAEVISTTSPPSSETTTPVNSTASTETTSPSNETPTPINSTASTETTSNDTVTSSTETTTPSNPTATPVVSTVNTTKNPQTEAPPGPTQSAQTTTTSNKTTAQPASTVTSQMTSGTTQTPVLNIHLTFHITNREFSSSLEDPKSAYYQEMNETIGQMYWNIYACPTCERKDEYQGYKLLGFRNGSIEVLSEVYFQTKEEPQQLAQATQQTLENANATELNNLSIKSVKASPVEVISTTSPPSSETPTPVNSTASTETTTPSNGTPTPLNSTATTKTTSPSNETETPVNSTASTETTSPSNETETPVNSTNSTETTTPSNPTATPVVSTVNTTKNTQTEAPPGPTQSAQTTTTSNKTTAQPASTVTSRMTSGTTQTPVLNIRLTFHITNREFNSSLEDPNSAYYQEMNETIGQMYWNIYACPTCERKDEYQGYKLLGFRNGSIEVLSEVYFQTKEEPQQLAQATQQTLENANATELNNLSIKSVKASPAEVISTTSPPSSETPTPVNSTASTETTTPNNGTPTPINSTATTKTATPNNETPTPVNSTATTKTTAPSNETPTPVASTPNTTKYTQTEAPPGPTKSAQTTTTSSKTTAQPASTVTSQKTSSTTRTPVRDVYFTYHITNRQYDSSLLDPTSRYYDQINKTIGQMYWNIYACSTCKLRDQYQGYELLAFREGSIQVWTVLLFQTEELPKDLVTKVQQMFENASPTQREQLTITSVQVSPTPIPIPQSEPPVPGWGIALLVLVCILLLLAIIAFILLIIYRCRRSHRGHLDLLQSRDSYHPMSEYPTYQTHGRYVAPISKPNPYSDKQPTNGTSPFSYTNPAMANDNF